MWDASNCRVRVTVEFRSFWVSGSCGVQVTVGFTLLWAHGFLERREHHRKVTQYPGEGRPITAQLPFSVTWRSEASEYQVQTPDLRERRICGIADSCAEFAELMERTCVSLVRKRWKLSFNSLMLDVCDIKRHL